MQQPLSMFCHILCGLWDGKAFILSCFSIASCRSNFSHVKLQCSALDYVISLTFLIQQKLCCLFINSRAKALSCVLITPFIFTASSFIAQEWMHCHGIWQWTICQKTSWNQFLAFETGRNTRQQSSNWTNAWRTRIATSNGNGWAQRALQVRSSYKVSYLILSSFGNSLFKIKSIEVNLFQNEQRSLSRWNNLN